MKLLSRLNPFKTRAAGDVLPAAGPITTKAGAVANPHAPDIINLWMQSIFGAASAAGVNIDRRTALGVSTVYACVDVLARTIATLPLNIYRRTDDGGRTLDTAHPLYHLLHDAPNPEMTSVDFRTAMQGQLSLHQFAYAYVRRNGFGEIVSLTPLDPATVEIARNQNGAGDLRYIVNGRVEHPSDIIHLRTNTTNGLIGDDLLRIAADTIGIAAALDRNAGYFFKNGSFPGGFLQHPGTISAEAAQRLASAFQQTTGGANANKVKVLEEGLTFKEGRSPNKDAQFDESRDRQAKDIAAD